MRKLFAVILVAIVALLPISSFAEAPENWEEILAAKDQEIAELKERLSAYEPVESSSETADTEVPFEVIKKKSKGDSVAVVQSRLIELGYLIGTADGSFGSGSEEAVKEFQRAASLEVTGVVDKNTYDQLFDESAPIAPEKPIVISAKTLYKEYNSNELAADKVYKGKQLQVSGTISSIDQGLWGDYYITLSVGQWEIFSVQCYFDSEYEDELAKLKKGKSVTVLGTCEGWSGNINIENCSLVK